MARRYAITIRKGGVGKDAKDYQIITRALEAYLDTKEINDRTAGA